MAYHEALSRLRHGFEFRPGRSSFTSITSSFVLRFSASTSDGFIRYRRTPLYIISDESEYIRNSKKLSRILRHRPDIPHDEHGWISMDDVEVHGGMDRGLVMEIARMNTRYEISEDGERIRAFHGHSIDVDYGDPVEPPEYLHHGTSPKAWDMIRDSGYILPMRRTEVHLSASIGYAKDVAGRRSRSEDDIMILRVDSGRMHSDGYVFHLSGDGVYLTENVPVEYVEPMTGDGETEW